MANHQDHHDHHSDEKKPVSFTVPLIFGSVIVLAIVLLVSLGDPKHGNCECKEPCSEECMEKCEAGDHSKAEGHQETAKEAHIASADSIVSETHATNTIDSIGNAKHSAEHTEGHTEGHH
jgi:hypothetical protein